MLDIDKIKAELNLQGFLDYINVYRENDSIFLRIIKFNSNTFFPMIRFIEKNINEYVENNVVKHRNISRIYVDVPISFNGETYTPCITILNFNNYTFNEVVSFNQVNFTKDVTFKRCFFTKEVYFNNSEFSKNIRIQNSTIFYSQFVNTTFNKLVDFYGSTFKSAQQFDRTDFLDRAIFSNAIFEKEVQFIYCKVNSNSYISFESAKFSKGIDISRANFNCNLNFWGVEMIFFYAKKSKLYCFNPSLRTKPSPSEEANMIYKTLRESYRIIKHELKSKGNNIEAQKFHMLEMKMYKAELNNFRVQENLLDRIMLFFNESSNDYGNNWYKGLKFTLLSACITFFITLITTVISRDYSENIFSISNFFKELVNIINLANWRDIPFNSSHNGLVYIFLFIGRIFIAYGIYQTIQAFRKYSRK